jgi:hypothetical protein
MKKAFAAAIGWVLGGTVLTGPAREIRPPAETRVRWAAGELMQNKFLGRLIFLL